MGRPREIRQASLNGLPPPALSRRRGAFIGGCGRMDPSPPEDSSEVTRH